ncbi:hypothetical protein ACHAXS_006593 [Conticribra weissflogii]
MKGGRKKIAEVVSDFSGASVEKLVTKQRLKLSPLPTRVMNDVNILWERNTTSTKPSWKIFLALSFILNRCASALTEPFSRAPTVPVSWTNQRRVGSSFLNEKHAEKSALQYPVGLIPLSATKNNSAKRPFVTYVLSSQNNQNEIDDGSFFLQASQKAAKHRNELLQEGKDPLEEFLASSSTIEVKSVKDFQSNQSMDLKHNTEAMNPDISESTIALDTEKEDKGSGIEMSREVSDVITSPVLEDDSYADLLSSISKSPLAQSLGSRGNAPTTPGNDDDTTSTETPVDRGGVASAYNFQRKLFEARLAFEKKANESVSKSIENDEARVLTQTTEISHPREPEPGSEQPVAVTGMTAVEPEAEDDAFFLDASRQAAKMRSELVKEGKDLITLAVGSACEPMNIHEEISNNRMDSVNDDYVTADDLIDGGYDEKIKDQLSLSEVHVDSDDTSPAENSALLPEKLGTTPELAVEESHETVSETVKLNTEYNAYKGILTESTEQTKSEDEIDPEKVGMGLLILTRSLLALKQIVEKE